MARKWPFRKELHHPNEIFHFAAAIGRDDVRGGARHHQNQYLYIGIFTHIYADYENIFTYNTIYFIKSPVFLKSYHHPWPLDQHILWPSKK